MEYALLAHVVMCGAMIGAVFVKAGLVFPTSQNGVYAVFLAGIADHSGDLSEMISAKIMTRPATVIAAATMAVMSIICRSRLEGDDALAVLVNGDEEAEVAFLNAVLGVGVISLVGSGERGGAGVGGEEGDAVGGDREHFAVPI